MKRVFKFLLIILIACPSIGVFVWSCSEEIDCSIAGRPMLSCFVYVFNEETERYAEGALRKLTVKALETDSIIINAQEGVKVFTLPLRYTKETTVLVLHYNDDDILTDTITITHDNTPYFVSVECGYEMKQSVKNVTYTQHVLDSVYVRNKNTNVNGQENFRLFYN